MGSDLNDLGRRVAGAQEQQLQRGLVDLVDGRRRLLAVAEGILRPSGWRRLGRASLITGSVMVAAALAGLWLVAWPRPLAFRVGDEPREGEIGAWVTAPSDRNVPLAFSDGTLFQLMPNARSLVAGASADGPQIVLDRGELRASVVSRSPRQWRVHAGPFVVRVTGTKFDVAWEPREERFSLTLRQGSVLVSGPWIGAERPVRAGQHLRVSCKNGEVSTEAAAPTSTPTPVVVVVPSPTREAPTDGVVSRTAVKKPGSRRTLALRSAVTPASPPSPAPWASIAALSEQGRYAEALGVAERAGFEQLCLHGDAAAVIRLGDVARLGGRPAQARQAYGAVRARFTGDAHARATFLLGRLAFDGDGDYAEASRLFDEYLGEKPDGPLAREALARLTEARTRAGDVRGARAAATRYLDRYAGGPFASEAKALLDRP